jgi:Na+/proline symporter
MYLFILFLEVLMESVFSQSQGLWFLALYGVIMVFLALWSRRSRDGSMEEFLVANRSISIGAGAISVAATWIWAPALFIGTQKAYQQGLPGLFWFTVPNVLCLIVFGYLATKVRRVHEKGFSLPQFIKQRHGKSVHILYLIQFLGLQLCSYAVQILAGAGLIHMLTGLSFMTVAFSLFLITIAYSIIGGIRASVVTDGIQMVLILGALALILPWVFFKTGGMNTLAAGLGGFEGKYFDVTDPWIAFSFGIPVTVGLMSGPLGDQQHWQRVYSLPSSKSVLPTFFLGAMIFLIVPCALGLLGFIAASPSVASGLTITDPQLVGVTLVGTLLPKWAMVVFATMLLSGLCSTLDSVLCATSSIVSVDLFPSAPQKAQTHIARWGMIMVAGLGLGVACIPGLKILHLFLFYGTFRAATMMPTICTILWKKVSPRAVYWAILSSLVVGLPMYVYGALAGNVNVKVFGSISVVLLGLAVCVGLSIVDNSAAEKTEGKVLDSRASG